MRSFEIGYLANYIQDFCLNQQKMKVFIKGKVKKKKNESNANTDPT